MLPAQSAVQSGGPEADRELLSALAGTQAARDNVVANRTRRVVLTSLGQLRETKANRKRNLAVASAMVLLVVLVIGPFVWRVMEDLVGGEHMTDLPTEFSLLICIFCPAIVAAVVVAGWARRRSEK